LAGVSEQTLYLPSDKPAELASSGLTKYASQHKERKKYTQNQSESEVRNQKMLQTSCMTRHCRLTDIPCPRHLLATDHTLLGAVYSYKQPTKGGIAVKKTGLEIEYTYALTTMSNPVAYTLTITKRARQAYTIPY
jgi:hypothetical protein